MTFLFVSESCPACTGALIKAVQDNYTDAQIIQVRYNTPEKKYHAFRETEDLGEAPITDTPSLYFMEKNELYTGMSAIRALLLRKLQDGNEQNRSTV